MFRYRHTDMLIVNGVQVSGRPAHIKAPFKERYFRILRWSGILSLIYAIPNIALFVTFLTIGFGVILWPVLMYFVVALIWWPAVYYWDHPGSRGLTLLCGMAATLSIFAAPHYLGRLGAMSVAQQVVAENKIYVGPSFASGASRLEVREMKMGRVSKSPCKNICYDLLASGQASWIRIIRDNPTRRSATKVSFFKVENHSNCRSDYAVSHGCITKSKDPGDRADLRIDLDVQTKATLAGFPKTLWYKPQRVNVFKITRMDRPNSPIHIERDFVASIFTTVLVFIPKISMDNPEAGYGILRYDKTFNRIDRRKALSRIGYKLPASSR